MEQQGVNVSVGFGTGITMLNIRKIRAMLVLCGIALTISACSRSGDEATTAVLGATDGVLQFVPADTPYVFATPEPMPKDVRDKLELHIDAILTLYREIMTMALGDIMGKQEAGQKEDFAAVIAELGDMMTSENLRAAGLSSQARSAFYGIGLIPVVRLELSDADAFEATVARLEEKSGSAISTAKVAGQTYRYVGDDKARLILAIIDNYLVVSAVPVALSTEQLSAVLGLTLPAQNIGSAGDLEALAEEYGYTPYALGFVDVERLIATFLDDQSGINAELLTLMEYDDSILTDVCRAEIRDMSGVMPRLAWGYTDISVQNFSSNMILELRKDIASGLATLAAPVPGLGLDHDGLFSLGMSIDLLAAREVYSARLDAMEADPYKCEMFAELQDGVAKGRMALNQPIPPLAYGFKGFLAIVDDIGDFNIAAKQPPTEVDMRLLIAIDNAEGLLAMGTMFSPELAALNLQPDGNPVKIEAPQIEAQFDEAYIAMTENSLGIAVGVNAEAGLKELLVAATAEPHPMVSMHMDAASYYDLIGEAVMASDSNSEADSTEGEAAELTPEVKEAISDIMKEFGALISRMSVNVELTERGVEFPTTITLAE